MKQIKALVAALALAASGAASADSTFLGVQDLGVVSGVNETFSFTQSVANPDGFYGFVHLTLAEGSTGLSGSFSYGPGVSARVTRLDSFNASTDPWSVVGTDTNLNDGFSFSGLTSGTQYKLEIYGNEGAGTLSGTVQAITAVPEPATLALALSGAGVLGLARRRQQRKS